MDQVVYYSKWVSISFRWWSQDWITINLGFDLHVTAMSFFVRFSTIAGQCKHSVVASWCCGQCWESCKFLRMLRSVQYDESQLASTFFVFDYTVVKTKWSECHDSPGSFWNVLGVALKLDTDTYTLLKSWVNYVCQIWGKLHAWCFIIHKIVNFETNLQTGGTYMKFVCLASIELVFCPPKSVR